jgi:hypothetical protein
VFTLGRDKAQLRRSSPGKLSLENAIVSPHARVGKPLPKQHCASRQRGLRSPTGKEIVKISSA